MMSKSVPICVPRWLFVPGLFVLFVSFVVFPLQPDVINANHVRGPFRCAVFDFDGTLSLLRGNWQGLMVPMMVDALAATGTAESRDQLTAIVEEFVTRLTGQPTMHQMFALAEEVKKRGQPRPDPHVYFDRYMDLLISRTEAR